MASEDEEILARLQAEHPGWKLWRPRKGRGRLWCASRLDETSGVAPTLIEDSAEDLVDALRRQSQQQEESL